MILTVVLEDPDDTFDVSIDARDRRAFERVGYRAMGLSGSLKDALEKVPDTYMAWLAWHAAARRGGRDDLGGFDDFDARLVDYSIAETAGEEADSLGLGDPTKPAASAG